MSTSDTESADKKYDKQLSEINQGELIDLYGGSGYMSFMQTIVKISSRKEEEIIRKLSEIMTVLQNQN